MRSMAILRAGLLFVLCAVPALASGITWLNQPDPKDTYLPHAKDLVLEETGSLTVQVRTNRHPDNNYSVGDKVRAIVAVSEDAYVYLVGVDEKWDVAQIFPGKQFTSNRLEKGREHAIPPEKGTKVGYYSPDLAGTQYLIAVATAAPVDLKLHLPRLVMKRGDFNGALAAFRQGLEQASPGCAVASCQMTIQDSGKVVAVVIGCGAYSTNQLGCTVADAKAFGQYLQQTYGAKLTMRTLYDRGRAEIADALQTWLPSQVNRGDAIYIYYSGHGANVKDDDGDEPDSMDEALVPTDYVPPTTSDWAVIRSRMIVDDDLHSWVKTAADKGASKTILVFDACHSGTAHRGLLGPAGPPIPGVVPKVYRGLFRLPGGGAPPEEPRVVSRALGGPDNPSASDSREDSNWGVIAACKDSEISWAGDPLSQMTAHLIEGLTKNNGQYPCDTNGDGKVTIKEAAGYSREKVKQYVTENKDQLRKSNGGGDPTQTVTTLPSGDSLTINE